MRLYKWQQEALRVWEENGFHGCFEVITGAGKTLFALSAAKNLMQVSPVKWKVFVVVPTAAVLYQWRNAVRLFFPACSIACFGDGRRGDPAADFHLYIVNSGRYRLSSDLLLQQKNGEAVLLIADECHHYMSPENRKIFDYRLSPLFDKNRLATIGLSATLAKTGFAEILEPALGPLVLSVSFGRALKENVIAPYSVFQVAVSLNAKEQAVYDRLTRKLQLTMKKLKQIWPEKKEPFGEDWWKSLPSGKGENPDVQDLLEKVRSIMLQRADISKKAKARLVCAEGLLNRLPADRKILIFCERVSQADEIYVYAKKAWPNRAGRYHSGMDPASRDRSLRAFREGSVSILCTCRALDEGLDVPDADTAIVLSSGAVSRQRVQRAGRILRRSDEGKRAVLFYLYTKKTADEPFFLDSSNMESTQVFDLSYHAGDDVFSFPAYDRVAGELLGQMRNILSADQEREVRRCLEEGQLRGDFLLPEKELSARFGEVRSTHEKNYYLVMRWIGELLRPAEV